MNTVISSKEHYLIGIEDYTSLYNDQFNANLMNKSIHFFLYISYRPLMFE